MWRTGFRIESQNEEERRFLSIDDQDYHKAPVHRSRSTRSYGGLLKTVVTASMMMLLTADVYYRMRANPSCDCSVNSPTAETATQPEPLVQTQSPYIIGNGFLSELPAAREAISYVPTNYTGLLTYSKATNLLDRKLDAPIEYFGEPSDAIEEAWENLVKHEAPSLLEHEIEPFYRVNDKDRFPWDKKLHFELNVFHTLHCLNIVRKQVNLALYPDSKHSQAQLHHESKHNPSYVRNNKILHAEHCMDRIRQDILCHADLSPSMLRVEEGLPIALSQPGERICRAWDPIVKWMNERWEAGELELRKQKAKDAAGRH